MARRALSGKESRRKFSKGRKPNKKNVRLDPERGGHRL